jgi:hypothetical protein
MKIWLYITDFVDDHRLFALCSSKLSPQRIPRMQATSGRLSRCRRCIRWQAFELAMSGGV